MKLNVKLNEPIRRERKPGECDNAYKKTMSDGWRQEQVLLFKIINVTMQAGKNVLVQIQCGKGKTTLIVN